MPHHANQSLLWREKNAQTFMQVDSHIVQSRQSAKLFSSYTLQISSEIQNTEMPYIYSKEIG